MKKPFTVLAIPLIIGILISYYSTISLNMVLILFIFAIFALIYNIIKGALNQSILIILILILGIFLGINGEKGQLNRYLDKRLDFVGVVDELINREEDFNKYLISIDRVDNIPISPERIVLNVSGNKLFELGERIYFNGELKLPKENTNPKLFNYRLNLMTEKIYTTMTIKEHNIDGIESENIDIRYLAKSKFSDLIINTFDTYLSENNARIMEGIFLGQSSYLKDEDIDTYRDMGLAHLLAVSGLHIGIISGFITLLLSSLSIKKRPNVVITLSIIWLYGYLIGYPPSILRSSIMFSLLYLSQLIHEPYSSINSISFAIFVLLLIRGAARFATISSLLFQPDRDNKYNCKSIDYTYNVFCPYTRVFDDCIFIYS